MIRRMPAAETADAQLQRTAAQFREAFGCPPTHAAAAPGRVNLIGEHTDYNDGFVLPLAIDRRSVVVAVPREDYVVRLRSTGVEGEASFDLTQPVTTGEPAWSNYLRGPIALGGELGLKPTGFDALVDSTVPSGGGLSSSAALEVSMLTLLEALTGQMLDPVQKALTAQKAEHEFANTPCGIMDQFISTMGKEGHALLIDCRDHSTRDVKLDDPEVVVLIINSNVKHELNGGEYAERRQQCEAAAGTLGVKALRDATLDMLESTKGQLDDTAYRRARHVIGENQRTLDCADALDARDYAAVGNLMFASHDSLRDDFEVSTPELDKLVELAKAHHDPEAGVIGSRMTGGGFGGCTVSLVRRDAVDRLADQITADYRQATGVEAEAFVTVPSAGAEILEV